MSRYGNSERSGLISAMPLEQAVRELTISENNAFPRVLAPESWREPDSHLRALLTESWYKAISALTHEAIHATYQFFYGKGFLATAMPLTTGSISSPMGLGSDSLPVRAVIQGLETYLADSMQFMLELGTRIHGGRPAYYVMPTFRGEPADERHLTQFYHAEVEIVGGLNDVMLLAEEYILAITRNIFSAASDIIDEVAGTTKHVEDLLTRGAFPRLRFEQAIEELRTFDNATEKLKDGTVRLTSYGERRLIENYGDFIWVTHMPWKTVPFYQACEDGTSMSKSADLLAGIGEILGSGERATSEEDVLSNLAAQHIDPAPYDWYIQMKREWPLRTSGFGLGLERYLLWLTRTKDIRNIPLLVRNHDRVHKP